MATKDFADVIKSRYSVRAFKPERVPQAVLEQVFSLANCAPSNCNTQPWLVQVVSGEPLETLRAAIPHAMMSGDISMDFPYAGKYHGVYKERQGEAANALFKVMGITREDKVERNAAFMRNFTFFDAPHVAFLFIPQEYGLREATDIGMYAQSLMLSLTAYGIGSCPQTSLGFHADLVRKTLGMDENFKLLFGISFGYIDETAAANQCRTARATVNENTFFHG
jgi:hypothetical protein